MKFDIYVTEETRTRYRIEGDSKDDAIENFYDSDWKGGVCVDSRFDEIEVEEVEND